MSNQDITPDFLRGFIVPAEITTEHIWNDESTFTQQGRRTGVPKSNQGRTGMVLSAIGEQGDQPIDIETSKGGTAGSGAGFKWKFENETDYYGFDAVNVATGFEWFRYSSSAITEYQRIDAVSHHGTLVGVYESFGTTNRRTIVAFKQEKSGTITTSTLFTQTFVSAPEGGYPSICRLADGSYLIGYISFTNGDFGQIKMYRSTDDGDTWDLISSGAFDVPIDFGLYDVQRIRMTANNNSILLVGELTNVSGSIRNLLIQYASIDNGCTFQRVGISSDPARHRPDVVTLPDGSFGLITIENTQKVTFVRLPYARFDVTTTTYSINESIITNDGSFPVCFQSGANLLFDGRLTVWIDDDGVLYCAIGNRTDKSIKLFTSDDNGSTWLKMSGDDTFDAANIFQPDSTGSEIEELSGCQHEGRSVLFGKHNRSIPRINLGGYTTRTFPAIVEFPKWYEFARFDHNWIPLETPDNGIWSVTGAGSSVLGTGSEFVEITTSTNIRYFFKTTTTTPEQGVIIRTRVRVDSGGSSTLNHIGIQIRNATVSQDFDATIRIYSTGFKIVDNNDSGNVIHTESVSMTVERDMIIAFADDKISIHYREWTGANERVWYDVHADRLRDGGGSSTSIIYWGNLALGTAVSEWSEFHVSEGDSTGFQMIGKTAAESFRQYPVTGDFLYLGGGVLISTAESPTYEGDTFEIVPKYNFPIERVIHDVSTSPRVQWRSEQTSGGAVPAERIAFVLDTDIGNSANNYTSNSLVGFHLSNINFRTFNVVRYDFGSSSWVTVDSIDTSSGMNAKFIRVGSTLIPQTGGTDVFYLHYGECVGWIVELDDGVNVIRRRVRQNSEGVWNTGFNGKQPVIHLDGCDNTEPIVGDVRFVPDVVSVIVRGDATGVGWGIEITSQNTIDNDFRIGTMLFGSLMIVAPTYGRGRAIAFESNRTIIETRDGTTIGRKYSDGGRVASISWTDGVDTSPVMGDNPNPNYWTGQGSNAVANYGDAPFQMLGLTRYVAGGVKPVVYIPSFEKLTGNSLTLNRYNQHLFGRTDGTVSIDHVVGDELQGDNAGEVFRIATVNITEIQ